MATKIITVEATPPAESTGADYYKGAPLNAAEFDQNLVNLRAAVDRKASLSNPTFTGTVVLPATTSIGDVSATELQYLNSVTSNVQDQINSKQATITTLGTANGGTGLTSFTSGGVVYASSSSALTTGSALVFDGANLGLGVTPSAWTTFKAIQIGSGLVAGSVSTAGITGANYYYDGAYKYTATGPARQLAMDSGGFTFSLAGSGSANSAITWTDAMRLDSSGNLLVGTTTALYNTALGKANIQATSSSMAIVAGNSSTSFTSTVTRFGCATSAGTGWNLIEGYGGNGVSDQFGSLVIKVLGNGNIQNTNNSYGALSDQKLKENIVDASPKLDDLCKVKVRNFNLIDDENKLKQIGVVAQELEEVFPGMVDETPDYEEVTTTDEDGNEKTERVATGTTTKSVKYSVFVPMLIKAVQEQQAIIESLTQRIEALEYTKQGE